MPRTRKTVKKALASQATNQNERPLTPHLLTRAPREQERWGVSSPPPGLT
jgi:hypothetical protein